METDEDFNYDREYKRTSGLGAFLGQITATNEEEHKSSTSSGETSRRYCETCNVYCTSEKNYLDHIRLSKRHKTFDLGQSSSGSNYGEFYCEICHAECNSEDMYHHHINGSKHAKKLKLLDSFGKYLPSNKMLAPMLKECAEPAIGLQYIEEFLPETKNVPGINDASYMCNLCCVSATSIPMLNHIVGQKHRAKYMEMTMGLYNLDKQEVIFKARQVEQTEGKRIDLIQQHISDVKFPWPPGKAPWCREMGGNGIPPEESKIGYHLSEKSTGPKSEDKSLFRRRDEDEREATELYKRRGELPGLTGSPTAHLLDSIASCMVKNDNDAALAFNVTRALVKKLAKYTLEMCQNQEKVKRKCDDILDDLEDIYEYSQRRKGDEESRQKRIKTSPF